MKILIVGSEGFIGSSSVRYFLGKQAEVTGIDLFERASQPYTYHKVSRLSPELEEILKGDQFDVILNAGGSGNVPYSMVHPLIDFEANSLDTVRLLDAIRKYRPNAKYIHLSSAAVYGNPQRLPISESDPLMPLSPYGWHKLISEQLCLEYSRIYGVRVIVLRPFSVFGPGLRKQMFWDLYQKLKDGGEIVLSGTGAESRDYISVADLLRVIDILMARAEFEGETYNVASGRETTIREAVETFWSAWGVTPAFRFSGISRAGDPANWLADISKIRDKGFDAATPLEGGLQEVVRWMKTDWAK